PVVLMVRAPLRSSLFPYTTLFRSGSWARAHPRSHAECNHRDDRQRATSIVAASNRAPAGGIWLEPYRIPTPGRTAQAAEEGPVRSEEHTSELQSRENLVCRLLLEK